MNTSAPTPRVAKLVLVGIFAIVLVHQEFALREIQSHLAVVENERDALVEGFTFVVGMAHEDETLLRAAEARADLAEVRASARASRGGWR